MQAIVLAAGEGSRMRPLTKNCPKVMLPVAGRPILEEIVIRAKGAGISEFVFVVGYGADAVKAHFGDGSRLGVKVAYVHQKEQLGTGDALACAASATEDRFLVLNGDVLPDVQSLRRMVEGGRPAVAAKRVPDPGRYGVFLLEGTYMKNVVEKSRNPPSDLANAGIYLLEADIFDVLEKAQISERGEFELTDGLNMLAALGRKMEVVEIMQWIEVGRPWDLLNASSSIMADQGQQILSEVEAGVVIKGAVVAGKGTLVRSGSYIVGPVVIGEGADIGPNCYIRPGCSIGNNVRIGHAVEIKNCIVMDGTKIGHLSYLGDSVIGKDCNFGAGTIVSNLRHDGSNVPSYVKGQKVDSGRRKLGVIMGDGVKTGINTTIYPGTVIDPGYRSRPGEVVWGHIPKNA
jgi:bifunctional UDP-N-acetylglucosamine pyrophosphorylase/glucosamine-1-phosphate N-acetyltransferase